MNARLIDKRGLVQNDVLLLSQRRIADLVAYCLAYEFEDAFAAVTASQRIDVTDRSGLEFSPTRLQVHKSGIRVVGVGAPTWAFAAKQGCLRT